MEERLWIEESYAKFIQENDTFYRCLFLPKFHPELNYKANSGPKYYIWLPHCDNSFNTMCLNIVELRGAANLPIAMIRRFARTTFVFLFAYRSGSHASLVRTRESRSIVCIVAAIANRWTLLDQSVDDNNFDANLEHLYYPFGRRNGDENIANDHGFDDEDPHFGDDEDIPLVVTASATTATEGVTLDDGLDD